MGSLFFNQTRIRMYQKLKHVIIKHVGTMSGNDHPWREPEPTYRRMPLHARVREGCTCDTWRLTLLNTGVQNIESLSCGKPQKKNPRNHQESEAFRSAPNGSFVIVTTVSPSFFQDFGLRSSSTIFSHRSDCPNLRWFASDPIKELKWFSHFVNGYQ